MIVLRDRLASVLTGVIVTLCILFALPCAEYGRTKHKDSTQPKENSPEANRTIDRIIAAERQYDKNLRKYSPRIETYLQFDRPAPIVGDVATHDAYFLGRLRFGDRPEEVSFLSEPKLTRVFGGFGSIAVPFLPARLLLDHFATSTMLDAQNFDRQHYTFEPVGWEYLGDVRCLATDVSPRKNNLDGAFHGRIWVEERNYAIVRLNGIRSNPGRFRFYTHFDSWRENLRPGEWLPVYIYSEESDNNHRIDYKANTRIWGYDLSVPHPDEEWTRITVDAPAPVHDNSADTADTSPVEGKRQLEMYAEQNVLWRLEKARLIAPPSPVDKVMETVLNNLVVTNHLDNLPPLHCRVMLTSNLESFTLRYTIVLSRGLIDVLPDEPGLAMILAHELGHVVLGHRLDTKYAFNDRMLMSDEDILSKLDLARTRRQENDADAKAIELLRNSPYKDKLGNAGLFLKASAMAVPNLPNLFGAHLGNRLADSHGVMRMSALMGGAPKVQMANVDQIAALGLGSRVQVNGWDGSVTFPNHKAVALVDPSEKLPFRVSPLFPHLTWLEGTNTPSVAVRQNPSP